MTSYPKSLVVAVLAVLAIAAGSYFGYPYYRAAQELRQGRSALADLDIDAARGFLEWCRKIQPDNAEAHFLLGRSFRLAEDDFGAAHRKLKEAERLGWPADALNLEYLLLQIQETGAGASESIVVKRFVETHSPEEPLVLQALAMGAYRRNRLDKTGQWLRYWVDHYPNDWRSHYTLAIHFQNIGRLDLAQPEFEKALELNNLAAMTRRWIGIVLIRSGHNYAEGAKYLASYLQTHPDDTEVLSRLAQAQWAMNDPAAARATVQQLLAQAPNHVGGLLTLAQLETDADHLTEALAAVERTENLFTTDMQELSARLALRARLLRLLGRDQEAAAAERQLQQLKDDFQTIDSTLIAIRKDSRDLSQHRLVGMLYLRVGQIPEGLRWLGNVLQARPDDAVAHQALADFYVRQKDAEAQRLATVHRQLAAEGKQYP